MSDFTGCMPYLAHSPLHRGMSLTRYGANMEIVAAPKVKDCIGGTWHLKRHHLLREFYQQ